MGLFDNSTILEHTTKIMRHINNYHASVPITLGLIGKGRLTLADAAAILGCSIKTIHNMMGEFGIEPVFIGTVADRKKRSEENKERNQLLENLAREIKDGRDIQEVSKEHNIPSRTLYRWVAKL